MAGEVLTVALSLALQVGTPSPSETPNAPPLRDAYNQYGFEGQYEQRHAFDTQQNWVHGYFQEIPAYGGHVFYRPYNYKDVLSQSQTAAGWGMSPTMPYSQQFWHRYHDQATMLKMSRSNSRLPAGATPATQPFSTAQPMILPAGGIIAPQPQTMLLPPAAYLSQPQGQPVYYAPPVEAQAVPVYAPAQFGVPQFQTVPQPAQLQFGLPQYNVPVQSQPLNGPALPQ